MSGHRTSPEARLRDTLTKADWSLPAWPDPGARLRNAAMRRRFRLGALLAVIVGAVIAGGLGAHHHSTTASSVETSSVGRPGVTPAVDHVTEPGFPAVGAPGFSARVYPLPVQPRHGGDLRCPNSAGVSQRPPLRPALYAGIVGDFGHPSYRNDLRRADRSLWPLIQAADRNPPTASRHQLAASRRHPGLGIHVIPALQDDERGAGIAACGRRLVERSVALRIGGTPHFDPPIEDIWVLRRHGVLLIWSRRPITFANGSFFTHRDREHPTAPNFLTSCDLWSEDLSIATRPDHRSATVTVSNSTGAAPCVLAGRPHLILRTATYLHTARLIAMASTDPIILRRTQTASATLTALPCDGRRRPYTDAETQQTYFAVDLSLGPCGASLSSYHLDS
jgi:hypothetical protein